VEYKYNVVKKEKVSDDEKRYTITYELLNLSNIVVHKGSFVFDAKSCTTDAEIKTKFADSIKNNAKEAIEEQKVYYIIGTSGSITV